MWSTDEVMERLRSHRETCATLEIVKAMLQYPLHNLPCAQCQRWMLEQQHIELLKQKESIDAWLHLLPKEERFLIQTHLIDDLDWAKTIAEYEKTWGVMNGRSERTLKRIQSKAIEHLTTCLNQLGT